MKQIIDSLQLQLKEERKKNKLLKQKLTQLSHTERTTLIEEICLYLDMKGQYYLSDRIKEEFK